MWLSGIVVFDTTYMSMTMLCCAVAGYIMFRVVGGNLEK